jgi:cobalamin biosynthesis Mg chelatase CobN
VPKGWKVELTKYKRKCFVNELNGDKWYLNYDQNGNHYFYNANNESVWHLPNVYSQENDDDKSANNTASSSNPNNSNFFKNLIDQELPTFKNLYSRLSTSSKRGNNQTTTVSSDQTTTTTKSSLFPARSDLNSTLAATATVASNSYLAADTNSTGISSSSSSGKQTTPSSSNSASRLIAPSTVPLTTVSYSNKPPSDLNFTFKCILLAKGGKKCRFVLFLKFNV